MNPLIAAGILLAFACVVGFVLWIASALGKASDILGEDQDCGTKDE